MFIEYEVIYRAKVMVTDTSEKAAIDQLHYILSSACSNIDGLLVGEWQTQTLPTEKANERTHTAQED